MLKFTLNFGLVTATSALMTVACVAAQPEVQPPQAAPVTPTPAVVESPPAATPAPPAPTPAAVETAQAPSGLKAGSFVSGEHPTSGGAQIITRNGQTVLVLDEAFATDRGPDLVVVLHRSANVLGGTNPPAYPLVEGDYVVLEGLKSTRGRQEYVIPSGLDLANYRSAAIWCQAFNATFGAASLN
jgi:hypothetical protein